MFAQQTIRYRGRKNVVEKRASVAGSPGDTLHPNTAHLTRKISDAHVGLRNILKSLVANRAALHLVYTKYIQPKVVIKTEASPSASQAGDGSVHLGCGACSNECDAGTRR